MTERVSSNIEITGVKQTVGALKAFAPEIHKRLNSEIRESLNVVKKQAQRNYPKGDWVVRINQKKLLGQITARGGGTRGTSWSDSSPGIRAAIFEFAGSASGGATPQARAMIESLNERYGSPGRFLWSAWDTTNQGENGVLARIKRSVEEAERDLQTHLESIGESF